MSSKLNGSFYEGTTQQVAQRMLGKLLVRQLGDGTRLSGIVVEVEAYLSRNDPACHAHIGLRKRNASMFAKPGTLYVYSIHRRHCLNVVTEAVGCGSAVLIRALEPVEGLAHMAALRGPTVGRANTEQRSRVCWLRSLTSGPGRLCQALDVGIELDAADLLSSSEISMEGTPANVIRNALRWRAQCTPRIGISHAREHRLRWFIDGHHLVSGCARDHSSGRHWTFQSS